MGPRAGLEVLKETKSLVLAGIQNLYCPPANLGYNVVVVVVVVVVSC